MSNPYWTAVAPIIAGASSWKRPWNARQRMVAQYSWAIPDDAALAAVAAALGPRAVEMGAGRGYWAAQLATRGVDLIAYDQDVPADTFFPVQRGQPAVLAQHTDRSLFLCWPPYDDPMATQCLQAYPGDTLVFIGEDQYGCVADTQFFELLDRDWQLQAHYPLPRWPGIWDGISHFERMPRHADQ